MNLYIKYGPLFYTYYTRRKSLKFAFMCLFLDIGFGAVSILYLYLNGSISISRFVISLFLFIGLFYLFGIFYEIGYMQNDIVVTKKEEKPTIRIKENLSNKFLIIQILLRILLGGALLSILFSLNYKLAIIYLYIIIITLIVFLIHNLIRNYFWNFITFFLLRFMKFVLVIPVIYFCIGTFDSPVYLYLIFLFLLMQFGANINVYNKYYGGEMKYPQSLMFFYRFIASLILWLFSKENLFLLYSVVYFVFFIIKTPRKYFSFKNNR